MWKLRRCQLGARRSHRWPSWLAFVVIGAAKSADVRGAVGLSMSTFAILNFAEAAIAQLGERQTEDLKVPGSISGLGVSSLGPEEVKWLDFQTSTL